MSQRNTGVLCPESSARYEILSPRRVFETRTAFNHYPFDAFNPRILKEVHDARYVQYVKEAYRNNVRFLDARDTVVTEDIFDQALLSASAGCHALDRIMKGEMTAAFCAVRPPGHHANRVRALGFCVFNNVAVVAKYAQSAYDVKKVLIVDWDVHPGNGTQEIFYEDPTVFTLSFHQRDLFPETGREDLAGRGPGEGFNRNVAFPGDVGRGQYISKFEEVVKDVARRFKPELLLIAAGFDAHKNDHVSALELTDEDFSRMTKIILDNTLSYTKGRTISLLEGGYTIGALRLSVAAHCKILSEYG